jgi:hypothetical protein
MRTSGEPRKQTPDAAKRFPRASRRAGASKKRKKAAPYLTSNIDESAGRGMLRRQRSGVFAREAHPISAGARSR